MTENHAATAGGPMLVGRGVRKTYRTGAESVEGLAGIDLEIHAGEFVAVMGPSGSGKTTLPNCFSRLDDIDAGTVEVEGREIHVQREGSAIWQHPDPSWWQLVMITTLLVITGCGAAGSESETAEPPTPPATPTEEPAADSRGEEDDPPGTVSAEQAATMTIAQVLRTDERFTRFAEIAERTEATIGGAPTTWFGLWDSDAHLIGYDREGVTVFAPTNAAFEALDPAILAVIDDPNVDNALLRTLLGAHYVPGLYPTAAFEPGPHPVHRGTAAPVELSVDPLAWGGHAIEHPDLRTANGYIHGISGVVIPEDITAAARND